MRNKGRGTASVVRTAKGTEVEGNTLDKATVQDLRINIFFDMFIIFLKKKALR